MSSLQGSRLTVRRAAWILAGVAVAAAAVAWLVWPRPLRTVRIGYRSQPPIYFAKPGGPPDGIAVDVVAEAARRLGLDVRWREISGQSIPAMRAGTIDIWPTVPVVAAAPDVHVTEPWLESTVFVMGRVGAFAPGGSLRGRRVAYVEPLWSGRAYDIALAGATRVRTATLEASLSAVCTGAADAAFIEGRQAQALLLERPPACVGASLTFGQTPVAVLLYGIGSTPGFAREAEVLRAEVARMSEDGTLGAIHTRWSLTTANETRLVYTLQQARQRTRWNQYGVVVLTVALAFSLWAIRRNRQARRLAEQASRTMEDYARQQERYRLLFERNVAGVVRTTLDGKFLDCNPAFARMLGCASKEQLLSVPASRFYVDPRSRELMTQRLQEEGSISNFENHIRRMDGTSGWLLESMTLIERGPDEPAILESTAIDVTEQRRLEEQYRQAQKLESVGRLAGGVAHDFNNLLTAINGYTELILADLAEDSPVRAQLEEIRKAGTRAAALTHQLLAFSRKQLLRPVVLDVNDVIADAESLLRRVIGEDVELVTRLEPGVGRVRADEGQLQQVVMNLAVNARDAMPLGGRLTIETGNVDVAAADVEGEPDAVVGPCVLIRVSDTGNGMDAETRQRAFEPFFTTKEVGKGTGLGLSTVYGIVRQSGGRIVLTSTPGAGTSFGIYLPRIVEAVSSGASSRLPVQAEATGFVLVVEEQEEVRRLAAEALADDGLRVLVAGDARAAIEIGRREKGPIQVLVVDVVTRGVSGPALADRLAVEHPSLKVLFTSGYDNPTLSGQPYLRKPFTPSELVAMVRELVGRADGAGPIQAGSGDAE